MTHTRTILTTAAAALIAVGAVLAAGSVAQAADDTTTTVAGPNAGTTDATDATPSPTAAASDATATTPAAPSAPTPAAHPRVLPPAVHDNFGTLKVSPAGPYKNGQKVTYTFAGFPANTPVVGSICIANIVLAGPQDCANLNGPHTGLGVADASGKGSLSLTVVEGNLGATAPAYKSYTCGNGSGHGCVFSLSDYSDNGPSKQKVVYVASASSKSSSTSKSTASSTKASSTSGTSSSTTSGTSAASTSSDPALASTGAGPARTSGLLGLGLLASGAVLLVAVRRPGATRAG